MASSGQSKLVAQQPPDDDNQSVDDQSTDDGTSATNPPSVDLPDDPIVRADYAACEIVDAPVVMADAPPVNAPDISATNMIGPKTYEEAGDVHFTNFSGELNIKRAEDVQITSLTGEASIVARSFKLTNLGSSNNSSGNGASKLYVNTPMYRGSTSTSGTLQITAKQVKSLTGHDGTLCVSAENINSFTSISGNLVIVGKPVNGVRPRIDSITNVGGNLILRNIDVGHITSVHGTRVTLDNANIEKVTAFDGYLYAKNGQILSGTSIKAIPFGP